MRGTAWPTQVWTLLRIDRRRPEVWISLGMAFVAAATVPVAWSGTLAPAIAVACGGLAAVAAVGVPAGKGLDHVAAFWIGRLAWPIGGAVAGGVIALALDPSPVTWQVGVALVMAVAATGWAEFRGRRSTCSPAHAASLALALAAAAACAAGIPGTSAMSAIVSLVCWAALAISAFAIVSLQRSSDPMATLMDAGRWHRAGVVRHVDSPHRSMVGSFLDPLAMASTLVAMVVCYFLAPDHAWFYVAVSAAWFVALAGPAATIAAGGHDAERRGLLLRSAPGGPRLPGSFRHAIAAIWLYAGIFGWPAVVAAVLWGTAAATLRGPLTAVVVLAVLAGAVAFVVTLAEETARTGRRNLEEGPAVALVMATAMAAMLAAGLLLPARPSLRSSAQDPPAPSLGSRC